MGVGRCGHEVSAWWCGAWGGVGMKWVCGGTLWGGLRHWPHQREAQRWGLNRLVGLKRLEKEGIFSPYYETTWKKIHKKEGNMIPFLQRLKEKENSCKW